MRNPIRHLAWVASILFVWTLIPQGAIAQDQPRQPLTEKGYFDTAYDRFGNAYNRQSLQIREAGDPAGGNGGQPLSLLLCQPGYFNLYFENGSGMEGGSTVEINRRAVICQLFQDLSAFITPVNPSTRVNIWIRNVASLPGVPNPSTSGILGLATGFYSVPNNAPTFSGIADNDIWRTINSGWDANTNVASPLIIQGTLNNANAGVFYHGMMAFNFSNPGINWHTDLTTQPTASEFDLYSVALHEATHALGFASLINANGLSKFGANFPYYSRYDLFLETQAGQPLITTNSPCQLYGYGFNPLLSTSVLAPNPLVLTCPAPGPIDNTVCADAIRYAGTANQLVYSPYCFEPPSSLSHFEDQCHAPSGNTNNLYFVMSNANGQGPAFMKRYLKPEERAALCDLGYVVGTTYGSPGNLNNFSYPGAGCPGLGVAGVNDGFGPGGVYLYTVNVGNSITLTTTGVNGFLLNDYNTSGFECVQDIYGNGTISAVTATSFTYNATTAGTALLRYIPVGSNGNRGNITYIIIRVNSGTCVPSPCDLITNGGFENGSTCGQYLFSSVFLNCWDAYTGSPDLCGRNCVGDALRNVPTAFCSPPGDTWNNGANNNDHFINLWSNGTDPFNGDCIESMQAQLSSPLIPATSYTIGFWARVANNWPSAPPNTSTITIMGTAGQVAPISCYALTSTPLTSVTAIPNIVADNQWHYYTQTFTYNGLINLGNLIILNGVLITPPIFTPSSTMVLLDEITLQPSTAAPTFTPPSPLCLNQTIPNLGLYANPPGGVFTGPGVTNMGGGVYSFTASTAGLGTHLITYTYTNNLGCPAVTHATIQVVNSGVTLTATASPSSICTPGPVTLTASPGGLTNYVWMPGGLTGPTVTVNPTSTTLYTVTALDPNGCTVTATVTVTVGSTFSFAATASPMSICPGQSSTLSATTGFTNYLWQPGSLPGNSVTVSPASTTTYTVTALDPNGCPVSATVTVTVNSSSAPVTATASPLSICAGQSSTLSASPGFVSYTWMPGSLSGASVTVTPGVTTTYTVTAVDASGCSSTATVTVTVINCGCSGTLLPSVLGTTSFVGGTYALNTPLTISPGATVNFTNAVVNIFTGMSITVSPGATLTLNHSHLWGCVDMWKGILVQPGGKIIVTGNTLIEDAVIAIDVPSVPVGFSGLALQVSGAIFNRNLTGIRISNHASAAIGYPYSVENAVFTCRILTTNPAAWPNTTGAGGLKQFITYPNPLQAPYFVNTFAPATLKAPMVGSPAMHGISLDAVGLTLLPVYYEIVLGNASVPKPAFRLNLYDNLVYGIHSINSNVRVINSAFQNLIGTGHSKNVGGDGIYAQTTNFSFRNRLQVIPGGFGNSFTNTFYDCIRGVEVIDYYVLNCQFTNMRSTQVYTPGFLTLGAPGQYGVYMRSRRYNDVRVLSNTMTNLRNGITFVADVLALPTSPPSFQQEVGPVQLNRNTIQAHLVGNVITNQYVSDAIQAINLITCYLPSCNNTVIGLTGTNVQTSNNTLRDVFRGIYMANWQKQFAQSEFNSIRLRTEPNTILGTQTTQFGISHVNSSANRIYTNLVFGLTTTKDLLKGIHGQDNSKALISCNAVHTLGRGFELEGLHPCQWIDNQINNCGKGFVVKNATTGILQGSGGNPACDNVWNGAWSAGAPQTFVDGGSAVNTPMRVRGGALYTPVFNGFSGFSTPYSSPATLLPTIPGPFRTCPGVPAPPLKMAENASPVSELLSWMADGRLIFDADHPEEDQARAHLYGYRWLNETPELMDSDPQLASFNSMLEEEGWAILAEAESRLAQGDLQGARALLSMLENPGRVQQAYIDFLRLSGKRSGGERWTQADEARLLALAEGCPKIDGPAVYLSRALYVAAYDSYRFFEDGCSPASLSISEEPVPAQPGMDFTIFPNPGADDFTLQVSEASAESVTLTVIHLTGLRVLESTLTLADAKAGFTLNLPDGIYMAKVQVKGKSSGWQKLVIQH